MNITITNPDQAEVGHLGKCLQKLAQYALVNFERTRNDYIQPGYGSFV